ncbi:NmrA family transcriptional regulator [Mucilaginibacter hurinus]|uniref:NmrA family transcriptional regulator n=1 Tax=Mucilaginibacter hurinus TaxID=2201324 RepID=A0A367GPD5_9SPHI|nr:NAD(P)H-binding protein [Mucilaginibacter hurinus]RCH55160.1 NmrA family transcriptional regulator [Mucilaginibacter hurinus]
MRILVIGGTGLTGRKVSQKLAEAGHEVVIGSPSQGVDILSGAGLAEALAGTKVVIDLSNSSSPEDETALNFFRNAAKNLIPGEKLAGVKHHLVLSIVGTDRAQYIGYLRAKKEQEDQARASGIPYTIIRSTQFHEHITTIINVQGNENETHVSSVDYQPIAVDDVAELIVRFALEEPKNAIVEIAGPEKDAMTRFVSQYIDIKGSVKQLIADDNDRYMYFDIPKDLLVPLGDFYTGSTRFEDWLRSH